MADGSDEPHVVDPMVALARDGADVVSASRYMSGGHQVGGPPLKRLMSRTAGLTLHWFAGVPTHDPTNNFKLYSRRFLDTVTIESTAGFELALELTVKATLAGRRVAEVPTTWRDRTAGQSNFKLRKWLPALPALVLGRVPRPLAAPSADRPEPGLTRRLQSGGSVTGHGTSTTARRPGRSRVAAGTASSVAYGSDDAGVRAEQPRHEVDRRHVGGEQPGHGPACRRGRAIGASRRGRPSRAATHGPTGQSTTGGARWPPDRACRGEHHLVDGRHRRPIAATCASRGLAGQIRSRRLDARPPDLGSPASPNAISAYGPMTCATTKRGGTPLGRELAESRTVASRRSRRWRRAGPPDVRRGSSSSEPARISRTPGPPAGRCPARGLPETRRW